MPTTLFLIDPEGRTRQFPRALHWLEERLGVRFEFRPDPYDATALSAAYSGADTAVPSIPNLRNIGRTDLLQLAEQLLGFGNQIKETRQSQLDYRFYHGEGQGDLLPVLEAPLQILTRQLEQQARDKRIDWNLPLPPPFHIHLTVDIDNLTAYYAKPWLRRLGNLGKSLATADWPRVLANLNTQSLARDPYYSFARILALRQNYPQQPQTWFLHLGDYGPYDKPLPFDAPATQKIWRELIAAARDHGIALGLHPSFAVSVLPGEEEKARAQLAKECRRFEQLTGQPPALVRMHYLRMRHPHTLQLLADAGIKHDYSLAYADAPGWAAGTHCPFTESETGLQLHPAGWMDVAAFRNQTLQQAQQQLLDLAQKCRPFGGPLCIISHNETFSDWGPFRGQAQVIENLLAHGEKPE